MYTHVEKLKANKNRLVANSVAQKKSNVKQSFGFVDNRPSALLQRNIQAKIDSKQNEVLIQKKLIANNTEVAQLRHKKFVEASARNHYSDGWGELYNITKDPTLKYKVINEKMGDWTKDLGEFYHEEEDVTRPCTIGYNNRAGSHTDRGGREWDDVITSIRHCGPSDQ